MYSTEGGATIVLLAGAAGLFSLWPAIFSSSNHASVNMCPLTCSWPVIRESTSVQETVYTVQGS